MPRAPSSSELRDIEMTTPTSHADLLRERLTVPKLLGSTSDPPTVLSEGSLLELRRSLPLRYTTRDWALLYSTEQHGCSLRTMYARLAGAGAQRFRLNRTHTVLDLKALVEDALCAGGEAPRPFVLAAGFPPKPLTDDEATVESAGLVGAAVTHRWV